MDDETKSNRKMYKCTFCEDVLMLTNAQLGLKGNDEPEIGALIPYSRCPCGFGKYVERWQHRF